MKVEVLASVMNASLRETVQHMNLQSDAVIINQCDRLGQEEMQISQENGEARIIRFYSFPDRGIGRSRNEAILRAEGDICLFSDADIVYEDGYETAILAVRRDSLLASGSTFSLLFGGGAKYSNGEDSLFLTEFIQKGYKVYTAPVTIGREEAGDSTWFHGYNEKFFHDRGVLYHYLYGRLAGPLALRFLYAHKGTLCSEVTIKQAKQWMRDGIREAGKRS